MKKKLVSLMLAICCLSVVFSGCIIVSSDKPKYEDREVEDFVVRFYKDYCEIKGTTEQGKTKRFLVVPKSIEGVRVQSFGYGSLAGAIDMVSGDLSFPDIKSDKLEKIYFESTIDVYPMLNNSKVCPNLKKIMYPAVETFNIGYGIRADVYYPRFVYENREEGQRYNSKYPANVSYYYNYENAKNDGYYWIDDCDYGGTIEYVPADPQRAGYIFGGWYKEAECINEWDFETDTLPEEKTEIQGGVDTESESVQVTVYQETILYAKWIEKN